MHFCLVALVFLAALHIRFLKYRAAFFTVPRVVSRTDYAPFANGAHVVDAWTSPSSSPPGVNPYSTPFHKPINPLMPASRAPPSIPELALGLTVDPRALWFFDGVRGTPGFALSEPTVIGTVRLNGHLSPGAAPRCLSRDLVVWGAVLPLQLHNLTWSMFEWPQTALPNELAASRNRGAATGKGSTSPPEVVWIPLAELHETVVTEPELPEFCHWAERRRGATAREWAEERVRRVYFECLHATLRRVASNVHNARDVNEQVTVD